MADRTVVVRLKAEIASYQAAMVKAKDSTKEFGREVSGAGKTSKADLDQIGRGATGMGVAATAAFALAVNATMGFDKQLSELAAVSSATAGEMDKLRDAALEAGAKTAFSAAEAAQAQTELAKAGVSTADILGGGLTGALDLAAAGGLDLARAAEIAAGAMGTFDLAGSQVTHVADVLAAGANKSAADVDELAQAMAQSGLVADQYGLDLEDTVGTLALFAQNQLKGSDAGTSFKTMLQRLTPTSKEAADQMKDLGIDFFDAQGNFVGIEEAAGVLQTRLSGLTQEQRNTAMATMFGSDAVRASTILYEEGAAGVAEWVTKVDDAGFAGEVAGKRMDNLAGDLEELRGSIETALIKGGSQATGALRVLTQSTTGVVNGFGEMPGPLQTAAMGLTAVAGAGGLALGGIAYIAPRAREAKTALEGMGTSGQFVARNLGSIAKGAALMGAGIGVFAAWQGAMESARAEVRELSSTWEAAAFSKANTSSTAAFAAAFERVNAEIRRVKGELEGSDALWDADLRAGLAQGIDDLADIGFEMGTVIDMQGRLARSFGISEDAARKFILAQREAGVDLSLPYAELIPVLEGAFVATTTGTVGAQQLEGAMGTLGDEVASVEDQVKAFNEALETLYDQMFGVQDAQDALQRTLNDLPDVLKAAREEGLSLNDVLTGQSNAAIDVRDHMEDMVQKGLDLVSSWQEQGIEGEALNYRIALLSASWRQQAIDAGLPAPVVDHYLGILGQVPATKNTAFNVDTAQAEARLWYLQGLINQVKASAASGVVTGHGALVGSHAAGGLVSQAPIYRALGGPSGTDTVPAWLTPGEYVMRKSAVDRWGVGMLSAMNGGMMPAGGGGGQQYVFSPTISVHATPGTDGRRIGQDIVDHLTAWTRDNGPLPTALVG